MTLVYEKAKKIRDVIANNPHLREMEISGFVKCIARDKCTNSPDKLTRINELRRSLEKQGADVENTRLDSPDILEALADLRNVAGLLFRELDDDEE